MSLIDRPYDESYPPSLWGVVPATGATAGIPGSWTPAGSTPPANVIALTQGIPNTVTASPATAWTSGQYVQTRTTGAAGRATWTGTAWVGGAAPLEVEPPQAQAQPDENPAGFTVAEVEEWVEAHPDRLHAVRAAEAARGDDARVTLLAWLDQRYAAEGG